MVFKLKWVGIRVIFGEVSTDEQSEINDDVYDVDDGFVFHESPIFIGENYNFMGVLCAERLAGYPFRKMSLISKVLTLD